MGHEAEGDRATAVSTELPDYKPIEMPRNSPTGFVAAFFAVVTGFALIWHIWWMVIVGLVGAFATFVVFAWRDVAEYELPAAELAAIDAKRREARVALVEGREPGITPVKYPRPPAAGSAQARRTRRARSAATRVRRRNASSPVTGSGSSSSPTSSCSPASMPPMRCCRMRRRAARRPGKLFNLRIVALETAFLLFSSFACGMATIATDARNMFWTQARLFRHGSARSRLPRAGAERVREDAVDGRWPRAQRLSLGVLHARRVATAYT